MERAMYHDRIREFCAICIAGLVMWMAFIVAGHNWTAYAYLDQFVDWFYIIGGIALVSVAMMQLVKGVLS